MKTINSPTTTDRPAGRRRFGMIAIFAAMVLVIAIVGGWLLLRSGEQTATDSVQDVAAAMRADDMDKLTEILGFDDVEATEYRFVEWHIGFNAQPEFSDVVETPTDGGHTNFRATVTYGDDSFYSQALGETLTTRLSGTVSEDGIVRIYGWPPPTGLNTVDAELRTWVEANRPELADEMFGNDYSGIRFSRRSGELRMEVLDDFLADRS